MSDIDLAVVVPRNGGPNGSARSQVLARYTCLQGIAPWLTNTILDVPVVVERDDLAAPRADRAVYFGPGAHQDRIGLAERPGLRGPTAGWVRVGGTGDPLPSLRSPGAAVPSAAWRELQWWWRVLLQSLALPETPASAFLCLKLIAEPARLWLALRHGEYPSSRREALTLARRLLPEEEQAFERALALERALPAGPSAPQEEFLGYLVSLSQRIASLLEERAGADGVAVALDWDTEDEFAGGLGAGEPGRSRQLPLADGRTLGRAGVRYGGRLWGEPPDETLVPVTVDPADMAGLTSAAWRGKRGPYPALRSGALLVLPSVRWPRTHLRAIQCHQSDPVSFALLEGRPVAWFSELPGFSAAHGAARAIAEHRAWLAHPDVLNAGGEALSMLITAARAGLFGESIDAGDPSLPLTVAATMRALRDRCPRDASALEAIEGSYRAWRGSQTQPPEALVGEARRIVTRAFPALQ